MKRQLSSKARISLALLWLALLAGGGWWLGNVLQVSGDLRKFMPARGSRRRFVSPDAAPAAPDLDVWALAWSHR
ncbi:hypothetical protein QSH18_00150 [Xanthomonas sp. NCPPB 2654]|uniref:hypothetical protein n=1 Tax=unclassified Xanthomonas TaxID=2643310 RepID=UPI0021E05482|nr:MULTISPECIES: hypothetical protein [unclassified Xanthomonas]MDL5364012.1 hypothetical protein [Xanthomonas sp. NCPPB 2654]UYC20983.1 hypothetical protein NUG20_01365 [Xanthomonas sp. CFBP 8443]